MYLAKVFTMCPVSTGVVSTTEDYVRFRQMFLNGGTFDGKRLLSRKTVELMTGNYVSTAIPTVGGGWID